MFSCKGFYRQPLDLQDDRARNLQVPSFSDLFIYFMLGVANFERDFADCHSSRRKMIIDRPDISHARRNVRTAGWINSETSVCTRSTLHHQATQKSFMQKSRPFKGRVGRRMKARVCGKNAHIRWFVWDQLTVKTSLMHPGTRRFFITGQRLLKKNFYKKIAKNLKYPRNVFI